MSKIPLFTVLALVAYALPVSVSAHQYLCSVVDPSGDYANDANGSALLPEPYQDIVAASVSREPGAVYFSMQVAAPIPGSPALMNPGGALLWMWGLNTSPGVPTGYPLAAGNAGLLEFWIHLKWDGERFSAEVIDRRPTLIGQAPIITAVPFAIYDDHLLVTAPEELFDDPAEFRWGATTWLWSSPLGSSGGHPLDRAPDEHVTTCTAT